LATLLYDEYKDNVFTFEYADEPVKVLFPLSDLSVSLGNTNYRSLTAYSECLMDAIKIVQQRNPTGKINIVAHSFGGLIARYAAKHLPGTVNRIITLDTGHLGFGLANFVDKVLHLVVGSILPSDIACSTDSEIGSSFVTDLNNNFDPNNPKLMSLAAGDKTPLPPTLPNSPDSMQVVDFNSSSMGQVPDNNPPARGTNFNNPPFCVLHGYNHATISQIKTPDHQAYQAIKKFFHEDSVTC